MSVLQASDLSFSFRQVSREMFEPPGFILALGAWIRLFGDSEVSVRILSALASILCVPLTYLLAGRFYGRTTAVLSAFAVAVSPLFVWYAQEARVYSLAAAVTLALVYVGLEAHRTGRLVWFFSFSLLSFLGVFLDYFVLWPVLFLVFWMLRSPQLRLKGIAVTVFFLLLFGVLAGPALLRQVAGIREHFWLSAPDFSQLGYVLGNFIAGYNSPSALLVASTIILTGLYSFWMVRSLATEEGRLLFGLSLAPLLCVFIFAHFVPVFVARKFLIFVPFFLVILARGMELVPDRRIARVLFWALSAIMALSLFNYHGGRLPTGEKYRLGVPEKKQFKALLGGIREGWEPGDMIVHVHPSTLMPALYYFRAEPVPQVFLTQIRNNMDYLTWLFRRPSNPRYVLRRNPSFRYDWWDVTGPMMDSLKGRRLWVISSDWSPVGAGVRGILGWRQKRKVTLTCDGVVADLIEYR
jgi:hypothetical protein